MCHSNAAEAYARRARTHAVEHLDDLDLRAEGPPDAAELEADHARTWALSRAIWQNIAILTY